eukprot:scaffold17261_cov106-Isochrysis_galbana.AAC.7
MKIYFGTRNGFSAVWPECAVASAVFSIPILSLGSAKDRPITDTDVQSDERPLALPRHPHGAARVRAPIMHYAIVVA